MMGGVLRGFKMLSTIKHSQLLIKSGLRHCTVLTCEIKHKRIRKNLVLTSAVCALGALT